MILHMVLFKFRADADPPIRAQAIKQLAALGEKCGGALSGVLSWAVVPNMDTRKDYTFAEVAIFTDMDAIAAFRAHPEHVESGLLMSRIADWVVGDFELTGLSTLSSLAAYARRFHD